MLPPVASRSFSLPASIGITTGARAPRKAPNRTFAGPIGWCFPLSQSRSVLGWTPRSLAHCSLVIFRSKRRFCSARPILCAGVKKATSPAIDGERCLMNCKDCCSTRRGIWKSNPFNRRLFRRILGWNWNIPIPLLFPFWYSQENRFFVTCFK